MDLRVLRYFLTVTQEESISAAADALHITQPTLSRQLLELEGEIGKRLFTRGQRNRRIVLTEEGLLLKKRAEEILDLVDRTQAELSGSDTSVAGDVYIGGGETHGMALIAQAAKAAREKHPQIRYHLYSGNADEVMELLDKGLLDFGVIIEPANLTKYDSIPLPAKDRWGVLMRKDCPLAHRKAIESKDLWDLPLIMSRQAKVKTQFSQWIKKDPVDLNIAATYNLLYNASLMVQEGLGYAVCLDKLINLSPDSTLTFKPLKPELEAALDMVWKKGRVFSRAASAFLAYMHLIGDASSDKVAD